MIRNDCLTPVVGTAIFGAPTGAIRAVQLPVPCRRRCKLVQQSPKLEGCLDAMTTIVFLPLPGGEPLRLAWPTPNRHLFRAPDRYFARTRANPDYGTPGWTRDCGRRFHRGCDIAPLHVAPTGALTRVLFTDCATGADYPSDEPTWVPYDTVYCVREGVVAEVVTDASLSDFGKHVVVRHVWLGSGAEFYTLYAHLAEVLIGDRLSVSGGQALGAMGQTSRSADARNWMRIAPHLHFEVRDGAGGHYDPAEFLRRYLPEESPALPARSDSIL